MQEQECRSYIFGDKGVNDFCFGVFDVKIQFQPTLASRRASFMESLGRWWNVLQLVRWCRPATTGNEIVSVLVPCPFAQIILRLE